MTSEPEVAPSKTGAAPSESCTHRHKWCALGVTIGVVAVAAMVAVVAWQVTSSPKNLPLPTSTTSASASKTASASLTAEIVSALSCFRRIVCPRFSGGCTPGACFDTFQASGVPTLRVAAVGDSITSATGSWAALLNERVNQSAAPYRCGTTERVPFAVEVTNLGRYGSGFKTDIQWRTVRNYTGSEQMRWLRALRPHMIVFMLGTNDGYRYTRPEEIERIVAPSALEFVEEMLDALASPANGSVVAVLPPRTHQPFWGTSDGVAHVSNMLRRLFPSDERIAAVSDVTRGMPIPVGIDGVHPNATGQEAIMLTVFDTLCNGTAPNITDEPPYEFFYPNG